MPGKFDEHDSESVWRGLGEYSALHKKPPAGTLELSTSASFEALTIPPEAEAELSKNPLLENKRDTVKMAFYANLADNLHATAGDEPPIFSEDDERLTELLGWQKFTDVSTEDQVGQVLEGLECAFWLTHQHLTTHFQPRLRVGFRQRTTTGVQDYWVHKSCASVGLLSELREVEINIPWRLLLPNFPSSRSFSGTVDLKVKLFTKLRMPAWSRSLYETLSLCVWLDKFSSGLWYYVTELLDDRVLCRLHLTFGRAVNAIGEGDTKAEAIVGALVKALSAIGDDPWLLEPLQSMKPDYLVVDEGWDGVSLKPGVNQLTKCPCGNGGLVGSCQCKLTNQNWSSE